PPPELSPTLRFGDSIRRKRGGTPTALRGNGSMPCASDTVVEFGCTEGVRRKRMRRRLVGVAVVTLGFSLGGARAARAANRPAPIRRPLHVDAMGWTGSTPAGGAEGEVVTANLLDIEEEVKNASRLSGKIVLVVIEGAPKKNEDSLFAIFGDFLKAAGKAGAVAVIGGQAGSKASGMNLTHTGILGFDADFAIPVLSMTAEDQGQLERYVESGKKVLV